MKRIIEILKNMILVLSKDHLSVRERWGLFYAYLILVWKRFWHDRSKSYDNTSFNILGFNIYIDSFNSFYWTFYEVFVSEDYKPLNHDLKNVIDCGGNIGITTIYFKWRFPNIHITVFEPHPENLKTLKKNVSGLSGVEVIPYAVSDKEEGITLYGETRAATISKALYNEEIEQKRVRESKTNRTKTVLLSNYIKNKIDFLKLDIEGAEGRVLRELFKQKKLPLVSEVTVEYHTIVDGTNNLESVLEILQSVGFSVNSEYSRTMGQEGQELPNHFMIHAIR